MAEINADAIKLCIRGQIYAHSLEKMEDKFSFKKIVFTFLLFDNEIALHNNFEKCQERRLVHALFQFVGGKTFFLHYSVLRKYRNDNNFHKFIN